tara:strand:- start:495 stop:731 length:237 start_codon:yes stop_codon:yes gene_type:complete
MRILEVWALLYKAIKIIPMMKMLFRGLLEASSAYYGDAIGLAPIGLSQATKNSNTSKNFWNKDCKDHPSRIACLNYES